MLKILRRRDLLLGINLVPVSVDGNTTDSWRIIATAQLLRDVVRNSLVIVGPLRSNTSEGHFATLSKTIVRKKAIAR